MVIGIRGYITYGVGAVARVVRGGVRRFDAEGAYQLCYVFIGRIREAAGVAANVIRYELPAIGDNRLRALLRDSRAIEVHLLPVYLEIN